MEQKRQAGKNKSGERFPMVASTLQGLEGVLANELRQIGGNDIKTGKRAVSFTADLDLVYKANLRLRTALRILKPLKRFRAADDNVLYDQVKAMEWDRIFDKDKTFLIRATVSGPVFTHSQFATLRCKDGIVDYFRDKYGMRPSIDSHDPDIVIHLRIYNNDVTISLDSSGLPLNRRGYRQRDAIAPLNESLAAGMLLIAGYDGKTDFYDGMCGSGTICIEAAMIANRISPGLLRDNFSFMHWKDYDEELFDVIREATVNRIRENSVKIKGSDSDFYAIKTAKEAAAAAGLDDAIEFVIADFFDEKPPKAPAFLVMNPPYGERISHHDIEQQYVDIGAKLKADYGGYWAWILSGNEEAMYSIGLRSYETHHLLNGKIPCRYAGFKMYTGTKD